jgi:hypothetical protein
MAAGACFEDSVMPPLRRLFAGSHMGDVAAGRRRPGALPARELSTIAVDNTVV